MAAFERGLALGSDGIECDVHLSRDGVPVVIHDRTLDRTTSASGAVSALTAAELARVDAGFHFGGERGHPFRGRGIGVPRLEDVLACFRDVRVIIEMKQGAPDLARAVIAVVRRTGAVGRVCVGSFHQPGLEVIRREAPEVTTSGSQDEARRTVYRGWVRWPVRRARPYRAFQVPERAGRLRVVTPGFVAQAHADRVRVDVWVVDRPEDMARLFEWGVDGIISDRPDVAVPARDEWLRMRGRARAGFRVSVGDDSDAR